jgi:hypothetical protein
VRASVRQGPWRCWPSTVWWWSNVGSAVATTLVPWNHPMHP